MAAPSSAATIIARLVLPRPGGPESRTWSGGSPRRRGALEHQLQLLAHPRLADELGEPARPQRGLDVEVVGLGRPRPSRDRSPGAPETGSARPAAPPDARRRPPFSASTASTACSAGLAGKPRPSSASTTWSRALPADAGALGAGAGATTLSRSSRTIRSAPLRPIPGTRVSVGRVAVGQRAAQRVRVEHGERGQREPRADAADRLQQREQLALLGVGEAEERQRVLAHDQRRGEPRLLARGAARRASSGWRAPPARPRRPRRRRGPARSPAPRRARPRSCGPPPDGPRRAPFRAPRRF